MDNLPELTVQLRLRGNALCLQLRHFAPQRLLPVVHQMIQRSTARQVSAQPLRLGGGLFEQRRELRITCVELHASQLEFAPAENLFLKVAERLTGAGENRGLKGTADRTGMVEHHIEAERRRIEEQTHLVLEAAKNLHGRQGVRSDARGHVFEIGGFGCAMAAVLRRGLSIVQGDNGRARVIVGGDGVVESLRCCFSAGARSAVKPGNGFTRHIHVVLQ
ncbi:hypothetical protein PXZ35_00090 [Paraburkholderia kururiensis]